MKRSPLCTQITRTALRAPADRPAGPPPEPTAQRLDKWLFFARFFKTRTISSELISGGHVRVNGAKVGKPAQSVRVGDVLTFAQGRVIRVVRIIAMAKRRGPASEAATLYEDLTPKPEPGSDPPQGRVGARPTKRDRRNLEEERRRHLE